MSINDINEYVPSLLNPRSIKKNNGSISLTQNSTASRFSLSLRRNNGVSKTNVKKNILLGKENSQNVKNFIRKSNKNVPEDYDHDTTGSLGFSAIEDLHTVHETVHKTNDASLSPPSLCDIGAIDNNIDKNSNRSLITIFSATELSDNKTPIYDQVEEPHISVSFGITNCQGLDITSNKSKFKRICVSKINNDKDTNVECEVIECSQISTESEYDENMNETCPNTLKRSVVAVNLEIKKKRLSAPDEPIENSKVLILNTNAIEKFSHVIVQPPNYKLVKRRISSRRKIHKGNKRKAFIERVVNNGKADKLSQKRIDSFFRKVNVLRCVETARLKSDAGQVDNVIRDEVDMSKNLGVADAVKCERGRSCYSGSWRDHEGTPVSANVLSGRRTGASPRRQDIKTSSSDAPRVPSPKTRNDSSSSHSPRGKVDSIQFSLPTKSKSNRLSITPRNIPHHKIVAGTHFAVDAFSYGDIPNVKHYFLTHFHSDHYSGLKKSFSKLLFCSKITADLCISRLGVSAKCIHVINVDETVRIEGVEVTAVEANHCPGAIMLLFTLPNGKTLLHTGDFRASPTMESYPIFWNKDIHTIYLDTTYCNPRYDFPTQDQSLEMALYILRQKKLTLEKIGKKFSQVLIVCGTYTIGKEKFFLGMARRVGCAVWACPEKDRVLQTVEGRSFGLASPHSCQLHVVPMRDLTHEKLRSYLDSLQGSFTEVVAFKPSGWENGKNSSVEKDNVVIHGIPYSEHSSFSEIIRFVKFLKPKQVVPTVDISGGVKAVQKYFPCPLVYKEDLQCQSRVTDYFSIHNRQQVPAVT